MAGPLVSIVIPTYNRARFIEDAVGSALSEGDDLDVVVIDDGSTDDTWQRLEQFGGRVRAIRSANKGASHARNLGIEAARGRYVRFLDSDDLIVSGSTKDLVAAATNLGDRQIAVGRAKPPSDLPQDQYGPPISSGVISSRHLLRSTLPCVLPLFPKASLIEAGPFDERLRVSEDQELAARLFSKGWEFFQTDIVAYEVRDHAGPRLTRHHDAAYFEAQRDAYERIAGIIAHHAPEDRWALSQAIWAIARDASRDGQETQANALFDLARSCGGRHAEEGSLPLKVLYRFLPPFQAEQLASRLKSARRR